MKRRTPASFVCHGCGTLVVRALSPAKDCRRTYCSLKCKMAVWWRTHDKKIYPPSEAVVLRQQAARDRQEQDRRARRINREIERVQLCAARRIAIATARQQARTASRTEGLRHICPNCGHQFRGFAPDVYCSTQCQHRYLHHSRYPSLQGVPLEERNHLAELTALVRSARRRLDSEEKGYAEASGLVGSSGGATTAGEEETA